MKFFRRVNIIANQQSITDYLRNFYYGSRQEHIYLFIRATRE